MLPHSPRVLHKPFKTLNTMTRKLLILSLFLLNAGPAGTQIPKPGATINRVQTDYQGKRVKARQLSVQSEIPMPVEEVWAKVQTPALLEFVAKGMIRFNPMDEGFPEKWEAGKTYSTRMRIWGILPFGGIHYLKIEKIDESKYQIATHEWDNRAKIWKHEITLKDLGDGRTHYEDTIVIYGSGLTGLITRFARRFYIHRQKRWQIVAEEGID